MDSRRSARLQILLTAFLFSTGGAAIKACTFSGWQVAGFRAAIAALTIIALDPQARRRWSWRTLLVGLAYAGTVVLFVQANKLTTSANSIFLQSTSPLYLLLLGPWLLQEPLSRRDIPFMLAIGIGLSLFFVGAQAPTQTAPNPFLGNILALCCGVSFAFTIVGFRWLSKENSPETSQGAVAAGNLLAFLICLPWAFPVEQNSFGNWGVLVFLGVVQIGLAYTLLTRAMKQVSALETSLLLLLEPALNPVWAWMVHGETPNAFAITGGALILGATILRALSENRTLFSTA